MELRGVLLPHLGKALSVASLALAQVPAGARAWPGPAAWTALALFATTLIVRSPYWGDPYLHVDEPFYLYAADRILNGSVLYVDIWDRKPVGLFMLFAGIRLLGGDGIIQYQLVASAFVLATSVVLACIARRWSGWTGACAAGVAYIAMLPALGGHGGQSPVFYNFLIAFAGLLTLRAAEATTFARTSRLGLVAMLLCGIAIQVKYTAMVEGAFFGLFLLYVIWHRTRQLRQVVAWGAAYAMCGLAPTAAALSAFAAIGHLDAFWFANFQSILLRSPTETADVIVRLLLVASVLLPLIVAVPTACWLQRGQPAAEQKVRYGFVIGWVLAAALGFVLIGAFYDHYALPMLVPLAIAAAPLFDRRPVGPVLACTVAIWGLSAASYSGKSRQSQEEIAALAESVRANLDGGCLFVFDGPTVLQHLTKACSVTRFVFPYHLSLNMERAGLGVDPEQEMRRVLSRRPTVIVDTPIRRMVPNPRTDGIMRRALARDYRLVASHLVNKSRVHVYALN